MKKVLVSDSVAAECIDILKKAPGIEVDVQTKLKPEELKAIIKNYDGLVVRSATKVTAEIIAAADKLAVIDGQIEKCQEALERNPGNAHIRRYFLAALQDKKQTLAEALGS